MEEVSGGSGATGYETEFRERGVLIQKRVQRRKEFEDISWICKECGELHPSAVPYKTSVPRAVRQRRQPFLFKD